MSIYSSKANISEKNFQLPETKNRTFEEIATLFRTAQAGSDAFPDYSSTLGGHSMAFFGRLGEPETE